MTNQQVTFTVDQAEAPEGAESLERSNEILGGSGRPGGIR